MSHQHELRKKILEEGYIQGIRNKDSTIYSRMKVNSTTIDYIISKLKEEKYFTKKRIEINLARLGIPEFAWVFISINWENFDEEQFYKKAFSLSHVHTIAEITGRFDYAIKIFGPSIQKISSFILGFERLFGSQIIDLEIHYSSHEYKRHYSKITKLVPTKIKKIDCLLIEEKNINPDISLLEIAKKAGAHRNTISNRWNHLWKEGVIVKECLSLTEKGYDELKKGLKVLIIINPTPGRQKEVMLSLINNDQISDLFSTVNDNLIAIIRTENSRTLSEVYKKMVKNKHIKRTTTIIFMNKKTRVGLTKQELKDLSPNCRESI